MAFGTGPHVCLGAAVARLEIKVALQELLARTTDIKQLGPIEYRAGQLPARGQAPSGRARSRGLMAVGDWRPSAGGTALADGRVRLGWSEIDDLLNRMVERFQASDLGPAAASPSSRPTPPRPCSRTSPASWPAWG